MNDTTIFVGIAAVGLYLYYQGKKTLNTVQQLSAIVTGIAFKSLGLFQSQIDVKLSVNNPTFNPLTFDALQCSLFIGGQLLAQVPNFSPGAITFAASTATQLTVPVTLNNLTIVGGAKDIFLQFLSGNFSLPVRVVGTLKASGLSLPFDTTVNLNPVSNNGSGGVPWLGGSLFNRGIDTNTLLNPYLGGKAAVNGIGCACNQQGGTSIRSPYTTTLN